MHWSERSRITNDFHMLLLPFKGEFLITSYPVKIRYDFYWKGRCLDTVNQSSMVKFLEDGMREIGLLEDDSPKYVSEMTMSSQKGDSDYVDIKIQSMV